ncbi:structural protein [Xanthomonas phage XaC1]|nr:structural protein [Xanthomonas phage XaC1]
MTPYTFYTIHTVIDIGDGNSKQNNILNSSKNLTRLLESIMSKSYPMMVSLHTDKIDLSKNNNSSYYALPRLWGECTISTLKFALPMDIDIPVDGVPLVVSTLVNQYRITKFKSTGLDRNISITKQTFSYA